MKKTFFTVGPTQLFPTVAKHMQEAIKKDIGSISHRGKEFEKIYSDLKISLRKLISIPKDYEIFFVSSGTEAMERIIQNIVEIESFHIITGSFSQKFHDFAKKLGKNPKKIDAKEGRGLSVNELNIPKSAELICFTQNETSTGVWISEKTIFEAKRRNPASLIAVDVVSSIPYVNLDISKADCILFSVQKGFGLPAGLGIIIVSPDAMEKSYYIEKKGVNVGSYHSFQTLKKWSDKNQTPETPPVLLIYLLGKVIKDMLRIGIGKIRRDTDKKAKLLYSFFDNHKIYKPFVIDPAFRSPTIINPTIGKKAKLIKKRLENRGLIVGSGYGIYKDTQIRIANFPTHTLKDIENLIKILKKV